MADWVKRLDAFLSFNDRELLTHVGSIQAGVAATLAEHRYDQFEAARKKREAVEADIADFEELRRIERRLGGGTD